MTGEDEVSKEPERRSERERKLAQSTLISRDISGVRRQLSGETLYGGEAPSPIREWKRTPRPLPRTQPALFPANKVKRRFCVTHGLRETFGCDTLPLGPPPKPKPAPIPEGEGCVVRRMSEEERNNYETLQQLEWLRHLRLVEQMNDPERDEELHMADQFEETDLLLRYRTRIDRTKEIIITTLDGLRMIGQGRYQMAADTSISWRLDELVKRIGNNGEMLKEWEIPGFGGLKYGDIHAYALTGEITEKKLEYDQYLTRTGCHVQHGFPNYERRPVGWVEDPDEASPSYHTPYEQYGYDYQLPRSASAHVSGLESLQPPESAKDFKPRPKEKNRWEEYANREPESRTHGPLQQATNNKAQRPAVEVVAKRPAPPRRISSDKDARRRRAGLLPDHRKPSQLLERCKAGDTEEAIADDDDDDDDPEDVHNSKKVSTNTSPKKERNANQEGPGSSKLPARKAAASKRRSRSKLKSKEKLPRKDSLELFREASAKKLAKSRKRSLLGAQRKEKVEVRITNDEHLGHDTDELPGPDGQAKASSSKAQETTIHKPTANSVDKNIKHHPTNVTFKLGPPDVKVVTPRRSPSSSAARKSVGQSKRPVYNAEQVREIMSLSSSIRKPESPIATMLRAEKKAKNGAHVDSFAFPKISAGGHVNNGSSPAIVAPKRQTQANPHPPVPDPLEQQMSTTPGSVVVDLPTSPATPSRIRVMSPRVAISPKGLILTEPKAKPSLSADQRSASVILTSKEFAVKKLEAQLNFAAKSRATGTRRSASI